MNFAQRVLGRLICCKSYAETKTIILNAAIVMTTPKTDYDLKKAVTNIEQTVNTLDLPKEEDLSLLNTVESLMTEFRFLNQIAGRIIFIIY